MPASSRKRNKGKVRKAKKEEMIRNSWQSWTVNVQCDHGCAVKVPDDHSVHSFMDLLFANIRDNWNLYDIMRGTLRKYPEVWNDNILRQTVINIIVRIGTNMLLKGHDISWVVCISQGIKSIEHYNGTLAIDSVVNGRDVRTKLRDLNPHVSSNRRDVLKFYRKRTTCKCMKKMHLEARKTISKMGICYGCLKEYKRPSLLICSRCMIYQYCSKDCQIANWPVHESICDIHVSAHQQHSSDCQDE